jgi:hypothetical protein
MRWWTDRRTDCRKQIDGCINRLHDLMLSSRACDLHILSHSFRPSLSYHILTYLCLTFFFSFSFSRLTETLQSVNGAADSMGSGDDVRCDTCDAMRFIFILISFSSPCATFRVQINTTLMFPILPVFLFTNMMFPSTISQFTYLFSVVLSGITSSIKPY